MIVHVAVFVSSLDVAKQFYSGKLGFSVLEDAIVRGPIVREFSGGVYGSVRIALLSASSAGTLIELVQAGTRSQDCDALVELESRSYKSWISILVGDLRSHVTTLSQRGVYPASEIFRLELPMSGRADAVFYRDPDGNGIEFLQRIP